jgi:hypothetical protein
MRVRQSQRGCCTLLLHYQLGCDCAPPAVPMQVIVKAGGPGVAVNACVWPSDRARYGHGRS